MLLKVKKDGRALPGMRRNRAIRSLRYVLQKQSEYALEFWAKLSHYRFGRIIVTLAYLSIPEKIVEFVYSSTIKRILCFVNQSPDGRKP